MRLSMRVLIYLALPSVAFAWLLQVDSPAWSALPLDGGFFYRSPDTPANLVEALEYAALGAGIVAVIVAIVKLFGVGSHPLPGRSSRL
jgi:hypothetical protein